MKTTLETYDFNLDNAEDREPYYQLKTRLAKEPGRGRFMNCISMSRGGHHVPAGEIELETEYLFSNQWNSDKGRVFDWYEEVYPNKLIKRGHYLVMTPEMLAIRNDTLKCGFTWQQFPKGWGRFNTTDQALASPYLKESELYLLRLLPVSDESSRAPLSAEERAELLPLYIQAQTRRGAKDTEKLIAKLQADYEESERHARMERDGFLWLIEHGVQTENCIFYNHTERFCFGWRTGFPEAARLVLLAALKRFPFNYDVK